MSKIHLYAYDCEHFKKDKSVEEINYSNILLPYYPNKIESAVPLGYISLETFLDKNKNPKEEIKDTFKKIEDAARLGDLKTKDKLKQSTLYYFTPTVQCSYRSYERIIRFNPIMVVEYDKIGLETSKRLKKLIFNRFESCICAYLSPSKKGVKFLFRIPIVNTVAEYKEYFYGLAFYLSQIDGMDFSNRNPVLPLFLSYDNEMLIREPKDLKVWTLRGFNEQEFQVEVDLSNFTPVKECSKWDKKWIKELIIKQIDKATIEQVGHDNVIKASLLAGGYSAGGYYSEYEAWSILENAITHSSYLSKNTKGYLRTAKQMFNRGLSAPLKIS